MRKLIILLAIMAFAEFAMAQTYTQGTGITGVDKLGAHQNGGRGCTGCHAPHSGARGGGGNAATGGGAVDDPDTGNVALWGQDLGPLYGQPLGTGTDGSFNMVLPSQAEGLGPAQEGELTGIVMCLSCHDGNLAQGAMMTNQSYEQAMGLLPPDLYGPNTIPTLLGNDGTAAGNYHNDHPIGPKANLAAVGLISSTATRVIWAAGACGSNTTPADCIVVNPADSAYVLFSQHYGTFQTTKRTRSGYGGTANPSGGRANLVMPDGSSNPGDAYLVCTTCHTPHSMYTFSGTAGTVNGTYPTYFFVSAPYNPGSNPDAQHASSATQFCRQCHFTGAGGSNEGSSINTVTTAF